MQRGRLAVLFPIFNACYLVCISPWVANKLEYLPGEYSAYRAGILVLGMWLLIWLHSVQIRVSRLLLALPLDVTNKVMLNAMETSLVDFELRAVMATLQGAVENADDRSGDGKKPG